MAMRCSVAIFDGGLPRPRTLPKKPLPFETREGSEEADESPSLSEAISVAGVGGSLPLERRLIRLVLVLRGAVRRERRAGRSTAWREDGVGDVEPDSDSDEESAMSSAANGLFPDTLRR